MIDKILVVSNYDMGYCWEIGYLFKNEYIKICDSDNCEEDIELVMRDYQCGSIKHIFDYFKCFEKILLAEDGWTKMYDREDFYKESVYVNLEEVEPFE